MPCSRASFRRFCSVTSTYENVERCSSFGVMALSFVWPQVARDCRLRSLTEESVLSDYRCNWPRQRTASASRVTQTENHARTPRLNWQKTIARAQRRWFSDSARLRLLKDGRLPTAHVDP